MAKKKRILLVEDVNSVQKAYKSSLELEGYSVTIASDLGEALDILNERTFHVALVDIMLDGEKNESNRDGVKIISKINELNEGTLIIPVTGQRQKSFVRDSFKDFGVFDFLDKHEDIDQKGWEYAVSRIEAAISQSELDDTPEWTDLIDSFLLPGEEQSFVARVAQITGGVPFDILRRTLCAAVREFQPLIGLPGVSETFVISVGGEEVVGDFWSKSHGQAVRFLFRRSQSRPSEAAMQSELFLRKKGKLELSVLPIIGSNRSNFLT